MDRRTVSLREELLALVPDPRRVADGDSERDLHAADLTFHAPVRPDVVVYPTTTDEVSRVLAYAQAERVPVTPFGVGSSLDGHVIPVRGGISLDLSRLDRILDLRPGDLLAVVQPGVTRGALERAAGEHGLWFPVDPGADATLGGMAATNAAGTTTVRYGKMRAHVLALEAVLPGGDVIRTGSAAPKTSAGYDLTGLLVGSEGTLAVITELTLRLHGIPEHLAAARLAFSGLGGACRTATALVAAGVPVLRAELLDARTIAAVNAYRGTSLPEGATLLVELGGSRSAVEADLETVEAVAAGEGCTAVEVEHDPTARARLWEARHSVAYALAAGSPGRRERSTDGCVPVTELAAAVEAARAAADGLGLDAAILAHAGDGNFHVHVSVDPDDPGEIARSDRLAEAVVADVLARGGTCSGEHGIGLGKIALLEHEHGDLLPLYQGIKRLFDPHGIMNPGKVLAISP